MPTQQEYEELRTQHASYFEMVEDPNDWRNPINKIVVCTRDEMDAIINAIMFFTATQADVTNLGNGIYRVKSEGYRNGPAGP